MSLSEEFIMFLVKYLCLWIPKIQNS